jgi:hypothetical protein
VLAALRVWAISANSTNICRWVAETSDLLPEGVVYPLELWTVRIVNPLERLAEVIG